MTGPDDDSNREVCRHARAFVRVLDKYEAGLLAWQDVVPFLDALRRAARSAEHEQGHR